MDKLITEILRLSFFRYILTIPLGLISLILLAVNIQIVLAFIKYITMGPEENSFNYISFLNIFRISISFFGENILIMLAFSVMFGELIALIGELKLFSVFRFIANNNQYNKSLKESSLHRIKSSLYPYLQKREESTDSKKNKESTDSIDNNEEFISLVDLVKVLGIRNFAEQSELNYSLARFFSGLSFIIKLNIFAFCIPLLMVVYPLLDKSFNFNNELSRTIIFLLISIFTILFFMFMIQKPLAYIENNFYKLIKDIFTTNDGIGKIFCKITFLSTIILTSLILIILLLSFNSKQKPDLLISFFFFLSFVIFYLALYLLISALAVILKSLANQYNLSIILKKEEKESKKIII